MSEPRNLAEEYAQRGEMLMCACNGCPHKANCICHCEECYANANFLSPTLAARAAVKPDTGTR